MRIAITGGIADGKSTVAAMIREMGYVAIEADAVVGELLRTTEVQDRIRTEVGERFVSGGAVEKDALREHIAESSEARQALDRILHPAVMEAILAETAGDGLSFAEVPLLIETATQGRFDAVWVCAAGIDTQRERLVERLGSVESADAMLGTQLPTAAKTPFGDRVLRTNQPLETVRLTVAGFVKETVGD